MKESVTKMFTAGEGECFATAEQRNGRMTRMDVVWRWVMPSNSAHVMKIDVNADGPYWSNPMSGGEEFISTNKPLALVEGLEALAKHARAVYERAMRNEPGDSGGASA
jgi:hypothetical protein